MAENFNYIAFGDRGYLEANLKSFSMNRGRVFEYTPAAISKALENLDAASIEFLEKLPTFLCTEIEPNGEGYSMAIRYGKIKNTQSNKYEVITCFDILIDFGDVSFESIDQARQVLEADKFQLYRTHWSIRAGSDRDIIQRLRELKPGTKFTDIDKKGIESKAKPPEQSKNIAGIARNVEDFLKILQDNPAREHEESLFFVDMRMKIMSSPRRYCGDGKVADGSICRTNISCVRKYLFLTMRNFRMIAVDLIN